MNRLTIAATLALGVHVVLLQIDIPWKPPVLLTPRSQAVDISLVTFKKPLPEQAPPKPAKVQPNPRTTPERRKKPVSKPLVQPRHAPRIVQPEPAPDPSPATAAPMPEPHEEVIAEAPAAAIPDETAPASDEEHAAVQMSADIRSWIRALWPPFSNGASNRPARDQSPLKPGCRCRSGSN
ncbi:MAG: hypothetical protein P8X96_18960 [Desulfobacteraceae bacterium]